MNKKKQRCCSVCHKAGHNKRQCAEKKNTSAKPAPPVLVRVVREATKSPHVIDLKNDDREKLLQGVSVYQEKKPEHARRVAVDFSGLVKQAVAKAGEKKPVSVPKKKKSRQWKISLPKLRPIGYSRKTKPLKQPREVYSRLIRSSLENFTRGFQFKKFAYSATALLFVCILPFPAVGYYYQVRNDTREVLEKSTSGFLALQSSTFAVLHSDASQAKYDLNLALESFSQASSIAEKEHSALVYVASLLPIIGNQVSGRQHLLSAGHHLALGNTYLVKGLSVAQEKGEPVTNRLAVLRVHLKSALPQYRQALTDLSAVDSSILPGDYQPSFNDFKLLYAAFTNDLNDLADLSQMLELVLGDQELKRYLLVFQNNNELRPTGGFMGSFAALDLQKGRIINLDVPGGGTYDLQGQLSVFVNPPMPLQLVNGRWEFQDANWFPDFAESAKKIEWFYQAGRNSTMDGVIAVNASMLERLLGALGPIIIEEDDLTLAQAGALETLQREVEVKYDKEKNQPKEVIGKIFGQLISGLGELENLDVIRLLTEMNEALAKKEIQIYFNDEKLQRTARSFGWSGEILPSAEGQDYLMVVNANIHGGKSDARILQAIEHQAVVQEDGSVIDTVFIRRRHNGEPGEMFYGVNNVSYLRVYVPLGSELLAAGGFSWPAEELFKVGESWFEEDEDLKSIETGESFDGDTGTRITREFNKTVFGNWVAVMPGEASEVYFTYKLPFQALPLDKAQTGDHNLAKWKEVFLPDSRAASRYSLLAQKQSGSESEFSSAVIYPEGWQPAWRSDKTLELAQNGALWKGELGQDLMYGVVMEEAED